MKTIDIDELTRLMQEQEDLLIIDVLPADSYRERHIPGAINIPLEEPGFVNVVGSTALNKDQPIVLYCGSADCDRSPQAARRLEEAGFTTIMDFQAGLEAWVNAGKQTAAV